MRVLLINPIVRQWAQPNCFPTGLGYIASMFRQMNYDVDVLDLNAERIDNEMSSRILHVPDMVGITGIITQYKEVKRIAQICRKEFGLNIPLICGGALATSVPDLLLEKTEIDLCVKGEGERKFEEPCLYSGKKGGVLAQKDVIKNLDTIPFPAYDLFPMDIYLNNPIAYYNTDKWIDGRGGQNNPISMNISGSRGCSFSCLFCYHDYMGQGYRIRSPKSIIEEMKFLQKEYKVEYIHFNDDAFCCSKKYMSDFCQKLHKGQWNNDFHIEWSCTGRANIMDEQLANRMASAGCIGVCYGLESGSQRMLDRMNKKITVDQYRKAIRINQDFFEYQDYSFIIGTPGETDETIQESIDFCNEMKITPNAVFYMTPYPGTPLFKELMIRDIHFKKMVSDLDTYKLWIMSLGEQGEKIAWDCVGCGKEKLREWHKKFIEETDAWNKTKH